MIKQDNPVHLYSIPGRPIPLQRPRYSVAHVYDSQKREKAFSAIYLTQQHNDRPLIQGPIEMTVIFYFDTPKKTSSLEGKYHTSKPDLDNLIKYISDVSSGILFRDDSEIAIIHAMKLYSRTPRTDIQLQRISIWKRIYYYVFHSFVKPTQHEKSLSSFFEDTLI